MIISVATLVSLSLASLCLFELLRHSQDANEVQCTHYRRLRPTPPVPSVQLRGARPGSFPAFLDVGIVACLPFTAQISMPSTAVPVSSRPVFCSDKHSRPSMAPVQRPCWAAHTTSMRAYIYLSPSGPLSRPRRRLRPPTFILLSPLASTGTKVDYVRARSVRQLLLFRISMVALTSTLQRRRLLPRLSGAELHIVIPRHSAHAPVLHIVCREPLPGCMCIDRYARPGNISDNNTVYC